MTAAVPARRAFVFFIACAMALSLIATLSSPVGAAVTFMVNSTADASDATLGDGFCATADPVACTLRAAIEEANALLGPDVISIPDLSADVLPDTYTLTLGELFITESVDIVGGGKALTIIDGGGENRVFDLAGDVAISNVTITGGYAGDGNGGGIFVEDGASATISGSTVSGNEAWIGAGIYVGSDASLALNLLSSVSGNGSEDNPAYQGGGIYNSGGTVTVTGSSVTGNRAYEGGGIYNSGGTVTVTGGSFISGNFAIVSEGGGDGAGIWNEGLLTVTNSTISGNAADEDGGGIYNSANEGDDEVTITDSWIKGNTADDDGAGIWNDSSSVVNLTNSTVGGSDAVDANHAQDDGGGIWSEGDIELTTSTVARNHATDNGGGISMGSSGVLAVDASTISRNTSDGDGGGIYANGQVIVRLHNSTVSGNTAFDDGGGVYVWGTLESDFTTVTSNRSTSTSGTGGGIWTIGHATFYATIVANNDAATSGTDDCEHADTSVTSFGSNIDSDDSCQFDEESDQSGVNPKLGDLRDNGGPTQTHALLTGSPAIDAVELAALFSQIDIALPTCPGFDQRGITRAQDGDSNGTLVCDIGAYELVPSVISITDVTVTEGNSGTVDAVFTVTLLPASPSTITVAYATANGTATVVADYQAAAGTVTFVPGDTSETITVRVVGDTIDEPNETFVVNLSAPVGATIADAQGIGTILDDDVAAIAAVPVPAPTPKPVQAIAAATGTPAAVISNTAVSQTGVSPIPTIAFALILLASLATLAYANVRTVRRRR